MKDLLLKLKACKEAVEWAGNKTAEEIIDTCHRGDWLLWLAYKLEVDDRPLMLAKGHCANTVRHLMKDERSVEAAYAAIAYGNGEISKEELNVAAYASYDAYYSAASAAYSAADAAAAYSAADAAYSADAAYYAAAAADSKSNQIETADICRKYLGKLILEKL